MVDEQEPTSNGKQIGKWPTPKFSAGAKLVETASDTAGIFDEFSNAQMNYRVPNISPSFKTVFSL